MIKMMKVVIFQLYSLHSSRYLMIQMINDDKTYNFLEILPITSTQAVALEMKTGQSSNHLWILSRKGHITASNHHEVLTKTNAVIHKKVSLNQKQPFLFDLSNTDVIKWARHHEKDALKSFYIQEAMNHSDYKITHCGLFVDRNKPYTASSLD